MADLKAVRWQFDGCPIYAGFHDGTYWNGWANIYVTPEVWAEVEAMLIKDLEASYEPGSEDYLGAVEEIKLRGKPDARGLCSLAYGYCAEVVSEDLKEAAKALLFESLDWQSALGLGARPSLDKAIAELGRALMLSDSSRSEAIQALELEFSAYCAEQGLPEASADELIHGDLSEAQRRYISDFIIRWEAAEAKESAAVA